MAVKHDLLCELKRPGQPPPCRIKRALGIGYCVDLHLFGLIASFVGEFTLPFVVHARVVRQSPRGLLFMRQEDEWKANASSRNAAAKPHQVRVLNVAQSAISKT